MRLPEIQAHRTHSERAAPMLAPLRRCSRSSLPHQTCSLAPALCNATDFGYMITKGKRFRIRQGLDERQIFLQQDGINLVRYERKIFECQ